MSNKIPTLDYHQFMTDDLELLKWLDNLICYGLVLITGAPVERRQLMSVASRVGYTMSTFYEYDCDSSYTSFVSKNAVFF